MEIKLHANATTTPRIRRYLQQSDKSDRELATELGISVTTVRRWRNREQVSDNYTTPKVIHKALRQEQVALVNALRDITGAPLDELLQALGTLVTDQRKLYNPFEWVALQEKIRAKYSTREEIEMFNAVMQGMPVQEALENYKAEMKDKGDDVELF